MSLIEDHFEHHAIIGHHSEAAVLMLDEPQGWTLPHASSRNQHPSAVEHMQRALRAQLGLDVSVLRCVSSVVDPANNRAALVYQLEHHNRDWRPVTGVTWVRADALDTLRCA